MVSAKQVQHPVYTYSAAPWHGRRNISFSVNFFPEGEKLNVIKFPKREKLIIILVLSHSKE